MGFPCLYKYKEGANPCQESSVREAAVGPCQWKVFVHKCVWERKNRACLFTANPWLSSVVGWSGLWCPLQNPAHFQQTPESCWSLTWSLDFKVWLTTQFHGLQLFIYFLLYCSQLCCDVPSCRVKYKSWSKYKLSELCWQTEPPRRCLLIPD